MLGRAGRQNMNSRALSALEESGPRGRLLKKAFGTTVCVLMACCAVPVVAAAQVSTSRPDGAHQRLTTANCTDSWLGGSGLWDSANWSAGVPNGNTPVVCITVPGSVVTVSDLDVQINALVVGGSSGASVTLDVVSSDDTETDVGAWQDSEIGHTGIVALQSAPDSHSYASTFGSRNGATLTNDGLITTSGYEDLLLPNFVNNADGTITLDGTINQSSCDCSAINNGSISVGAGATWDYSATSFTQSGGTVSNHGSIAAQTTFNMVGGRETHNPIELSGFSHLRDSSAAGAASFTLAGANSLSGVITAAQKITLVSTAATETATNLAPPQAPSALTNYGTITLEVTAPGSSNSLEHAELINHGTLNVSSTGSGAILSTQVVNDKGGTIRISGAGCLINGPLTNHGTLTLGKGSGVQLNGFHLVEAGGSTLGLDIVAGGKPSAITGPAHVVLGGTLRVTTIGHPNRGSLYTPILLSGYALTGKFAKIVSAGTPYTVSYAAKSMTLTAQ